MEFRKQKDGQPEEYLITRQTPDEQMNMKYKFDYYSLTNEDQVNISDRKKHPIYTDIS